MASWLRGCAAYVSGRAEPPLSPPPARHARTVLPLSSGGAVCTHRTEAMRCSVAMRRRRRAAAAGSCNTASMLRACHPAGARGGSGAKAAGPRRPSACGGGARSRRTPPARRGVAPNARLSPTSWRASPVHQLLTRTGCAQAGGGPTSSAPPSWPASTVLPGSCSVRSQPQWLAGTLQASRAPAHRCSHDG